MPIPTSSEIVVECPYFFSLGWGSPESRHYLECVPPSRDRTSGLIQGASRLKIKAYLVGSADCGVLGPPFRARQMVLSGGNPNCFGLPASAHEHLAGFQ